MSSSSPPSPPPSGLSSATTSATDPLFLETVMNRLHLRPPFLETNSFLSHSFDNFLLSLLSESDLDNYDDSDDADDAEADEDMLPTSGADEDTRRRALTREEAKLEREIVRLIRSGGADDALKPNSGQSISIGDHNICVTYQESGSEYRIWEWHGHIMLFDYEDGYSPEYIYGNYFERVAEKNRQKKNEVEEDVSRDLGLRDLIADPKDSKKDMNGGGRVLHRNALNRGSTQQVIRYRCLIKRAGDK